VPKAILKWRENKIKINWWNTQMSKNKERRKSAKINVIIYLD
jgi:hypothetical protein